MLHTLDLIIFDVAAGGFEFDKIRESKLAAAKCLKPSNTSF